ncbi:MAG: efflux transporter outer membrane subunit [Opitutaceae bacterium]
MSPKQPIRRFGPRAICASLALVLAGGCAVGPNYRRPTVAAPAAFKEAEGWTPAAPADDTDRGPWWNALGDPELGQLESQVALSNQSLQVAEANYEAARQIARGDRSTFFPTLSLAGSANRSKAPSSALSTTSSTEVTHPVNTFSASLQAAWEPDLWGKIRRQTEADIASAQASAADVASARLSTQSTLAQDYIELRILDDKIRLLQDSVDGYRRSLQIAQNKYAVGVAAKSDVIQAQTQLDSTRAQWIDVGVQRAQLEHAIAVLIGRSPADFSIAPRRTLGLSLVQIPSQLPSTLLERRPDVAQAEREVASANAKIGVQTSGYFPDLTLSADGGYQSSVLQHIFTSPDRFWSLGSQLSEPLFNAGQTQDLVKEARASYNASVANYRQTVLTAFQQVEDQLAALGLLAQEAQVEDAAVTEAAQASQIALNEYNAGTVDYTTVVTAQAIELNNREAALAILQSRLTSGVALIAALGGGWSTDDLPTTRAVLR